MKPIKLTIHHSHLFKKFEIRDNETIMNEYKQFANYYSDNNSICYDVASLTVSQSSLSTSSTSSSSFGIENNINENKNLNVEDHEIVSNFLSSTAVVQAIDDSSLENSMNTKYYRIDSKTTYSKKLVLGSCDLLLKFISELNACTIGLLSNQPNSDWQAHFLSNTEYVTPSRFCRRSSTKSWETGSGTPEAICFSVNRNGIHISGVRVYSFSMGQLKYQLQILHQTFDEKIDKNNFKWRTLSSVSGMLSMEDNQNSEFCELRFERPIQISANVKVYNELNKHRNKIY